MPTDDEKRRVLFFGTWKSKQSQQTIAVQTFTSMGAARSGLPHHAVCPRSPRHSFPLFAPLARSLPPLSPCFFSP
eukprot:scaffold24274_cov146-Isochrysis_galbana.AAC.6